MQRKNIVKKQKTDIETAEQSGYLTIKWVQNRRTIENMWFDYCTSHNMPCVIVIEGWKNANVSFDLANVNHQLNRHGIMLMNEALKTFVMKCRAKTGWSSFHCTFGFVDGIPIKDAHRAAKLFLDIANHYTRPCNTII